MKKSNPCIRTAAAAVLAIVLTAFARPGPMGAQTPGTSPDSATFPHDPALFTVLAMDPGRAQSDSFDAYDARVAFNPLDTLAAIAENPDLHPLLRANATLLIGRRRDLGHFIILRPLLDAADPRIRLATVAAVQEYYPILPEETLSLLGAALDDPDEAVQARALEGIADRDATALREYLASEPAPPLATVANGLLQAAEQRGAPLEPAADGTLRKTGPGGGQLVYRPTTSWTADISAGVLELEVGGGRVIALGDSIEVARNVIPAFFSTDGSRVVFESARTIVVHDISTGERRKVGPGVAPRPLPFTDDFIYAAPVDEVTTETRGQVRLSYDLMSAPFAEAAASPEAIGTVVAIASYAVAGGASPVRWMRVTEDGGVFSLRGEGIDPVPLPDPFIGGPQ